MTQAHIVFSGRVQGVGFRFTVQRFARQSKLTGWVRNCPDGTVEALIQGTRKGIDSLCEELEQFFNGYITNKDIRYEDVANPAKEFEIKH